MTAVVARSTDRDQPLSEAMMDATLEIPLDAAFLEAAEAAEREPAELIGALMREFVERERLSYRAFLERKVAAAQKTADAGGVRSNEEVERYFAEKKRWLAETIR